MNFALDNNLIPTFSLDVNDDAFCRASISFAHALKELALDHPSMFAHEACSEVQEMEPYSGYCHGVSCSDCPLHRETHKKRNAPINGTLEQLTHLIAEYLSSGVVRW